MDTMSKRMAMRLPVDEDDYLLPSPAHMGSSMGYMDLISDGKASGKFVIESFVPHQSLINYVF